MSPRQRGFSGFLPPEFFGFSGLASGVRDVTETIRFAQEQERLAEERERERAIQEFMLRSQLGEDRESLARAGLAAGVFSSPVDIKPTPQEFKDQLIISGIEGLESGVEPEGPIGGLQRMAVSQFIVGDPNAELTRERLGIDVDLGQISLKIAERDFAEREDLDAAANALIDTLPQFRDAFGGTGVSGLAILARERGLAIEDERLQLAITADARAERQFAEGIKQFRMRHNIDLARLGIDQEQLKLQQEADNPWFGVLEGKAKRLGQFAEDIPAQMVIDYVLGKDVPEGVTRRLDAASRVMARKMEGEAEEIEARAIAAGAETDVAMINAMAALGDPENGIEHFQDVANQLVLDAAGNLIERYSDRTMILGTAIEERRLLKDREVPALFEGLGPSDEEFLAGEIVADRTEGGEDFGAESFDPAAREQLANDWITAYGSQEAALRALEDNEEQVRANIPDSLFDDLHARLGGVEGEEERVGEEPGDEEQERRLQEQMLEEELGFEMSPSQARSVGKLRTDIAKLERTVQRWGADSDLGQDAAQKLARKQRALDRLIEVLKARGR
jgi:hypothetical protein